LDDQCEKGEAIAYLGVPEQSMEIPLQKYTGGMIGSALGDAIGEIAFSAGNKDALERMVERSSLLRYTDDTAMAIGIAESICEKGTLDQRHLGDTFKSNYQREPWRGYASGPPMVFEMVDRAGTPYRQAASRLFDGQGSFGNGAAMRVAPVGLLFGRDELYDRVRTASEVTHTHPVGVDGAAVLAAAVSEAARSSPADPFEPVEFADRLAGFARTGEIRYAVEQVRDLIADRASEKKAASLLGTGVAVHHSMPFALFSFLKHPGSFKGCLLCAVLNRGDCDTLGAMACGISGAWLGIGAVPALWRHKLENLEYIEQLAGKLWELARRDDATSPG
jgi:poly(ADP-ribose) glycohydrolase ARH3